MNECSSSAFLCSCSLWACWKWLEWIQSSRQREIQSTLRGVDPIEGGACKLAAGRKERRSHKADYSRKIHRRNDECAAGVLAHLTHSPQGRSTPSTHTQRRPSHPFQSIHRIDRQEAAAATGPRLIGTSSHPSINRPNRTDALACGHTTTDPMLASAAASSSSSSANSHPDGGNTRTLRVVLLGAEGACVCDTLRV